MSKPELLRAPRPAPPPDLLPRKTQPSRLTARPAASGGLCEAPAPPPPASQSISAVTLRGRPPGQPARQDFQTASHPRFLPPPFPSRPSRTFQKVVFHKLCWIVSHVRRPPHGSALLPAHARSRMFLRALEITCSPPAPHHLPMVPGPMPGPDVKISKANTAWVCRAARRRSVGSF